MKYFLIIILFVNIAACGVQKTSYKTNTQQYQNEYVSSHEVIKGDDKKKIRFFPVNKSYCLMANFEPIKNADWFNVPTSSGKTKAYRKYGQLSFKLSNKALTLYVYQAQALIQKPEYWDHLFLPFGDATNGIETYETGRYIDLKITEIKDGKIELDFNKAYNPYCAYLDGIYNCPIPPKENRLAVAIKAGEKNFLKTQ